MNPRLRAVCDLTMANSREYAGLHDYDGQVQDLSPSGLAAGVAALGKGPAEPDVFDEAFLTANETALRTTYSDLEFHRRNPLAHLGNLDLSCYERDYAPADERREARRRHLAAWPDAIDGSIESLDQVPAPVAAALLVAVRGLTADIDADDETNAAALAAHTRLVAHLEASARDGDPDASIGADALARTLGEGEATVVDLGPLAAAADAERDRLRALLTDSCHRLDPDADPGELFARLARDHPDPEGIYAEARAQITEATAFTIERDLLGDPGGECLVGPAPPARSWAMAMMSPAAPFEADAPSWYYVTPPDPSWPKDEQEAWLQVFSRTTLPAITVHEVTPGHYAHGRYLRTLTSDVRRALGSYAFIEGWAHYCEELFVEEGFRADDPRFAIGMAVDALIRVTRLAVSIGVHTGAMTVDEATARFERDAFLEGPAARSEANRATFDPGYGSYTWGKLALRDLREKAKTQWGAGFTLRRFHEAVLDLGSPPIGLQHHALNG
ncbi:MAG: hypothetical protein QOG03_1306 [Actinomycetota bacterium]|jgi:hypothetical protein|nr:hypothetical protein [Actinomycetota bacterium]